MMGMNISQLLGNDPDVLRSQIMQQEMARYNQYQDPRMNLASTLGGLLGGGVVNVAQGRNFFESSNPVLRKASELQNIYNQTAQSIDPNANPGEFYKALQSNLAAAGYGPQAAMAAQEAYKYSQQEREYGLKERQVAAQEAGVESRQTKGGYQTDAGPAVFRDGKYYVQTENGEEQYKKSKHGPMFVMQGETPMERILRTSNPSNAPGAPGAKTDTTSQYIIKDGKLQLNPNYKLK
jgi:hypothetical protein